MEIVFYDQNGEPIAYTEDGIHIYLYSGEPVAYLSDESIYSFDGTHLGWFVDGWVLDHSGYCVYYTDHASGGPVKPARSAHPAKAAKWAKPAKGAREARPARPAKSVYWSDMEGGTFFRQ